MSENEASDMADFLMSYAVEYAIAIAGVVIILVVGFWAAGWAKRLIQKALGRSGKIDPMVAGFLASMVRYVIIAIAVISALDQFGVETTSFVALLGAAGLAIGLAFQGALGNLSAGVMLLVFRPFKQGQFIDAGGVTGTVDEVSLFVTEMHTADNVQIIVPNAALWNTAIRNFSHHATRRVDLVLGIGYGDNIGKAMDALKALAEAESRIHSDPAPMFAVSNLGDSSVDITIRLWCDAGDYWGVRFDFIRAMKEKMDEIGVEIPYPQRSIHMIQEAAE